ncbi:MAG: hypothetical protein LBI84_04015 [Propionibacteriaceae bacterium]|jgi:hypothetical protein|nr:hypothetical protein [Propionibacteriaceae bacterium]
MPGWLRKGIALFIAAFALFYIFTRPEDAAAAVKGFFGAFDPIVKFFQSLIP